ncbi:MAG TPA: hypothetical protein VGM88_11890 [Kofleriaceae bacterium]|jgi:hypothetical protein
MHQRAHEIQQLLVGADWACAHGDAGGLADVARRLAPLVDAPLRTHLSALHEVGGPDPFARWARLRPDVTAALKQ